MSVTMFAAKGTTMKSYGVPPGRNGRNMQADEGVRLAPGHVSSIPETHVCSAYLLAIKHKEA